MPMDEFSRYLENLGLTNENDLKLIHGMCSFQHLYNYYKTEGLFQLGRGVWLEFASPHQEFGFLPLIIHECHYIIFIGA